MTEDKKTGFWTINSGFKEKVTFFKVEIEEGSLLSSPKITKVASVGVNHHMDVEQTEEEKGEYHENEKTESKDNKQESVVGAAQDDGVGNEDKGSDGGFAEGFNLGQTKHEIDINRKHANELVESLRKNGIDLGENGLNGIDLKALFKNESKKRVNNKDANESSPKKPFKGIDANDSSGNNPWKEQGKTKSPKSKPTSTPTTNAEFQNSTKTVSSTSSSESSTKSFSTPMKTKTGKFFKKLKSSPKTLSTGKKYCHVQASVPIKNEHNGQFEVVLGVTAINELNRGEDKHMFEFRPAVFIKSLQTSYSTWDEDDYKFEVGSMSSVTERILESHSYSGRIRAYPGLLNNDFVSFNTYAKYQAVLRVNLESTDIKNATNEVPKLIQELQKILQSPDWFLCYQIAAYWEFVCPENTQQVDDVLNELWTKAAGKEDSPSFSFIKNGLTKVFRDAMKNARGGLYGSMITDARNNLSQDLGNSPIVSKIDLKLDEFLVDEDIATLATHFFNGYSKEAERILFKTQFDDRNMNNFF